MKKEKAHSIFSLFLLFIFLLGIVTFFSSTVYADDPCKGYNDRFPGCNYGWNGSCCAPENPNSFPPCQTFCW